jgi:phenylacetate-CoA ligase
VMHGLALIYTVRDLTGVEQFKVVQQSLTRTLVQLVVTSAFRVEDEQRIVRDFRARLGAQVEVVIERVTHIAPERSGKYRYVVSHVSTPAMEATAHA